MTAIVTFTSCNKDDEPDDLTIVSITASGNDLSGEPTEVDLNGAASAEDVPVEPTIVITFSTEVDETSVTTSTVSLEGVESSVSVAGAAVTITPSAELQRGTVYNLVIGDVSGSNGGGFTASSRSFKTGGRAPVVAPQEASQVAFWKFDGDATDEGGVYNPDYEHNIVYVTDRHGQAASTAQFDGDESIIEIENASDLMVERSGWTISFWMYMDTTNNLNANGDAPAGQWPFGMGAFYGARMEINGRAQNFNLATRWEIDPEGEDAYTRGEGFSFNGDGNYNATGGWRGHTFHADLTNSGGVPALIAQKWSHIIFTYDASTLTASIFVNGELMKEQQYLEYDPHPQTDCVGWKYAGEEPTVYPDWTFGFVQSRRGTLWDAESFGNYDLPTSLHFKGMLDDFRIFSAAYTAEDADRKSVV